MERGPEFAWPTRGIGMVHQRVLQAAVSCAALFALAAQVRAGMPAVLPSDWTQESTPSWAPHAAGDSGAIALYPQGISFFLAALLLCSWAVKGLWNVLRKDLTWLPALSYGRSLSLVVLWGLLFVVVLTMISGARELMTPGAWRKQGWTYRLAEPSPAEQAADGQFAGE